MKTKHVEQVTELFDSTGRFEKERMIMDSPLTNRDAQILINRFVKGRSLKETADRLGMEYEALCKAQRKAIEKFYSYQFPN